ncbi:MAG: hypothetical protein ACQESR_25800, partial [Planctomycetota bacterium]
FVAVHGCRDTACTQEPAWMPRACPVVVHARRYKPVRHTTPRRRSMERNGPRDKPVAFAA